MIYIFDEDGDDTAINMPIHNRTKISARWLELIGKEKELRAYMDMRELAEPFIGQYNAFAWITPDNMGEFLGFFLKRLATADNDIFIFHYDGGYVAFGGHSSETILQLFERIENEMYANCMRTLLEKIKTEQST